MSEKEPRHIVVLITAPNGEEAATIARALVESRLAACVNIVRDIRSIYTWKGNIEDDGELLLIAKTRYTMFDRLKDRVRELHSYETPEIIAIPIVAGSDDYLQWIDESTGSE